MSDDDFMGKVERHWKNRGLDYSPDKLRENFRLYGPQKRAASLDTLDEALANFTPETSEGALREALEMTELRQALDDEHHSLLRVGR